MPPVTHRDQPANELLLSRLTLLSGAFAATTGALVLVGWLLDIEVLQAIRPGKFSRMMPNTALAFVLAGLALLVRVARGQRPPQRWQQVTARVLTGALLALSSLTLIQYLFGWDAGIDQLLFTVPPEPIAPIPGRPSLNATLSFMAVGAGLLLLGRRNRLSYLLIEVLAAAVGLSALVALAGYFYGAPPLYGIPGQLPATALALHSALAFAALSVGLLCAPPTSRLAAIVASHCLGGVVSRRLLRLVLIIPVLGLLAIVGERAGFYDQPVAFALVAIMGVVVATGFILATGHSLNRLDAERSQRESELLRWKYFFEGSPVGAALLGPEGHIETLNSAFARMHGASREELLGRDLRERLTPQIRERLGEFRRQFEQHGEFTLESEHLRMDGTAFPVLVSMARLPSLSGEQPRHALLVQDLTDRKRAEEALRRAHDEEHRLRLSLEQVSRASLAVSEALARMPEVNLQGVLQTIVEQTRQATRAEYAALGIGTTPEEAFETWVFAGLTCEQAHRLGLPPLPVDALKPREMPQQALRTAGVLHPPDFQSVLPHPPEMARSLGIPIRYRGSTVGNLYLASSHTQPEFTEDDMRTVELLASRVGYALETARLYDTVALERAWLQAVLEQLPEAVILTDAQGRVTTRNRSALSLMPPPSEEGPRGGSGHVLELCSPAGEHLPEANLPLACAIAQGRVTRHQEYLLRQPHGRRVPVRVSASPIRNSRGDLIGAAAVVQDISTLKELERMREEWTSVVAHDLRQPVSVISLAAQQLLRLPSSSPPESKRKLLERIRSRSGVLEQMISDLLDASRLETERLTLERHEVDLEAWVREVIERLEGVTAGHAVRVEGGHSQGLAWIDRTRIEQVLGNLLSNAAKYAYAGTDIHITLQAREEEFAVAVSNEGMGIPPEELHQLFQRYARSRPAREQGLPGIGLGLYISRGLVEAHGGRMWAESTPGRLTTFHFTLPRSLTH